MLGSIVLTVDACLPCLGSGSTAVGALTKQVLLSHSTRGVLTGTRAPFWKRQGRELSF